MFPYVKTRIVKVTESDERFIIRKVVVAPFPSSFPSRIHSFFFGPSIRPGEIQNKETKMKDAKTAFYYLLRVFVNKCIEMIWCDIIVVPSKRDLKTKVNICALTGFRCCSCESELGIGVEKAAANELTVAVVIVNLKCRNNGLDCVRNIHFYFSSLLYKNKDMI